jgi:serine/threonine-protein kinase Chk2
MSNSDIVALIYPHVDVFGAATRAIEASSFYNPPLIDPSQSAYDTDEDDSTQISNHLNVRIEDTLPFAKITFDYAPKTNRGILIGSSPACDLVVRRKGVSSRHISLTFDEEKRLIIKDWGSLAGIQVTYDGEGAGERSKFRWIVGGDKIPDSKLSIILELHKTISFRIIIPYHDISCPEYIERVDRFCRGTASPEALLEDLDLISRPGTMLPTGVNTPGTGDIYLEKRLGEGSFGEVTHLWNVSTGQDYALKTPSEKAIRSGDVHVEAWRREARIMGQVSHASITRTLNNPMFY